MGQTKSTGAGRTQQVVLMGLDSAGKSTLLYKLQRGEVMDTKPTLGFNVGTVQLDKNLVFTVWDVGGQRGMRPSWKYHLEDCRALVFVVDSSDRGRLSEAQKALRGLLKDEKAKGIPLIVLANKQDVPNSMSISELSSELNMSRCTDRAWEIHACSALKGVGLEQAFRSMAKLIKD